MATVKYLKTETSRLYSDTGSNKVKIDLLWGDRVEIQPENPVNGRVSARARGQEGYVKLSDLGDDRLLEVYFIDVGQGDSVLVVTPDGRHILVDGGYKRKAQNHGKSAADFVDWKFFKDYGRNRIKLDCMVSSHCDTDHYGGLWDLVNPGGKGELDCREGVEILHYYHPGVAWWKKAGGKKFAGATSKGYITDLMEDSKSVKEGLKAGAAPELAGEWADFLQCLVDLSVPISRLSFVPEEGIGFLPGFDDPDGVAVRVIGPVETMVNGKPALKDFGNDSQNTNGNSLVFRIDYGRARILVAGDLNKASQQYLLQEYKGKRLEFAADVFKSCHHGSDDCSMEFLETVHASASVISSGDNETHSHPRPNIVAACGATGFRKIQNDEMITPLVFCTEVSRSVRMADPYEVDYKGYPLNGESIDIKLLDETRTDIWFERITSPGLKPSKKKKPMNQVHIVDGLVYGLVNVRTDGNTILCATLNEGKSKWEIKKFQSRF
ncbi:MAG: MBL fold metallo-hydrolase [Bacteroidales bacterium]|jgi:beta-lactamase superfamily II metal-dependent hydrolase|nr:MBL fold metallo-hydrolase [Bacteroidales bacterium]